MHGIRDSLAFQVPGKMLKLKGYGHRLMVEIHSYLRIVEQKTEFWFGFDI
jgi:hypothetical protein